MHQLDYLWNLHWEAWSVSALIVACALIAGVIINAILFRVLARVARLTRGGFDDLLVQYGRPPSRFLVPALFLSFVTPSLPLSAGARELYTHFTSILLIASCSYAAMNVTAFVREVLIAQVDPKQERSLSARKIITQVRVAEKVIVFVILLLSVAFVLMTFDSIRQVGVSILASAGVAGVILGFAAQRSIGTVLAGLQIALTQPIRIDDVVVVEGEWGTIEEISLTYVVVKLWDLRRLVVPITYFIEKPFQNWTRRSADLLGTVFLYTDYGVPVDAIRAELKRTVEDSPLWDGKTCGVQVTDAKPNVLELRCLVSAENAPKLWDLRCLVREHLIDFVQKNHPASLPRVRAEFDPISAPGRAANSPALRPGLSTPAEVG